MHHDQVTAAYNADLYEAIHGAESDTLIWDGPENGRVNCYTGNWRDLEIGVIDAEANAWFTFGNCGPLALALHDLTGWQLVVLHGERPDAGDADRTWIHILVRHPSGDLLDIEGLGSESNKQYPWARRSGLRFEDATRAQVVELLDGDLGDIVEIEREIIRDFARLLVRKTAAV